MRGYLSRGKARAMIVLESGGVAMMLIGLIPQASALVWIGMVAVVLGLGFIQGCPHCGKHSRFTPQWSKPGKYFCLYCGQRLRYDDEE